jgi:hypothetical protein
MTQEDRQQDDAPEGLDGIVVAAVASGATEGVQEPSVRQDRQEVADRLEAGAVFEGFPGEERLGDGETQGGGSCFPLTAGDYTPQLIPVSRE